MAAKPLSGKALSLTLLRQETFCKRLANSKPLQRLCPAMKPLAKECPKCMHVLSCTMLAQGPPRPHEKILTKGQLMYAACLDWAITLEGIRTPDCPQPHSWMGCQIRRRWMRQWETRFLAALQVTDQAAAEEALRNLNSGRSRSAGAAAARRSGSTSRCGPAG